MKNPFKWHVHELYIDPLLHKATAIDRHYRAIIKIPLFSMVIQQEGGWGCFLIRHPLSLSTIKETLKHFLLKQNERSRSTFSKLIYMPFRLCSINRIFHVFFFHQKMPDDYAECHPARVGWIAENLWKCSALPEPERERAREGGNILARAENAPCWIFISFNRQLLWTYKGVFVKCYWSSQISLSLLQTHPGHISASKQAVLLPDVIIER